MHTRNRSLTRGVLTLLTCSFCCNCVPVLEHYQRVEAPGAVYLQSECGDYGPTDVAYYPFQDIFISVHLYALLQLGLHYAAGTDVHLNSDAVLIRGHRRGEVIELTVHVRHEGAVKDFLDVTDPLYPSYGGRRSTKARGLLWESFVSRDDQTPSHYVQLPEDLVIETIELPAITIDGHSYSPQVLQVTRRSYRGVLPINC